MGTNQFGVIVDERLGDIFNNTESIRVTSTIGIGLDTRNSLNKMFKEMYAGNLADLIPNQSPSFWSKIPKKKHSRK